MLTERIIGALTFRRGVYADVEADKTFTASAWILVVIFALLNQLGSYASQSIFDWLVGAGIGVLTAIAGFAIAAAVINWVGRRRFSAEVTFNELVRTMGLASIWSAAGVLGVIAAFSKALSCILGPAIVISWVALVVAWFVAVHEAPGFALGKDYHHRHYRFHPLGDHHVSHRRRFILAGPDRERIRQLVWLVV